jgi:hypothetical protein
MGNCNGIQENNLSIENKEIVFSETLKEFKRKYNSYDSFEEDIWNSYAYPCYFLKMVKKAYYDLENKKEENKIKNEQILLFSFFFIESEITYLRISFIMDQENLFTLLFSLFDKYLHQNDYYNQIDFTYQYKELKIMLGLDDNIENKPKLSKKRILEICNYYLNKIRKDKKWKIKFHGDLFIHNVKIPIKYNAILNISGPNSYIICDDLEKENLINCFLSYEKYFGLAYIYL